MSTSSSFTSFSFEPIVLQMVLAYLPDMIVQLGGIILLIIKWRALPRAALLGVAGLTLHLLAPLAVVIVSVFQSMSLMSTGTAEIEAEMASIQSRMWISALVHSGIQALAFGLLIAAILTGMKRPRHDHRSVNAVA